MEGRWGSGDGKWGQGKKERTGRGGGERGSEPGLCTQSEGESCLEYRVNQYGQLGIQRRKHAPNFCKRRGCA